MKLNLNTFNQVDIYPKWGKMITEKQLNIMKVFKKDLLKEISFTNLKKELKESSTSKLQRAVLKLKEENLIKTKKIGKSILISLNYENNKLFGYLLIFNFEHNKKIPFEVLYKIQNEILKETEFFSLVVFGSYASGNSAKKSDLDIAVIVENEMLRKKIIPRINSVKRKEMVDIQEQIILRDEFLEMLKDEKENLGKEIVRNHFVFYGIINFYKLIFKGAQNVRFN